MYDKDKLVKFGSYCKQDVTVQEVIDALSKLPPTSQVCFCGQPFGYLHVTADESVCSFDTETDSTWYDEETEDESNPDCNEEEAE